MFLKTAIHHRFILMLLGRILTGSMGWRSGENARLPPMCLGFDSRTRRHMWAEFVGSLLCSERFSPGTPVFPSPQKPTFDLI